MIRRVSLSLSLALYLVVITCVWVNKISFLELPETETDTVSANVWEHKKKLNLEPKLKLSFTKLATNFNFYPGKDYVAVAAFAWYTFS